MSGPPELSYKVLWLASLGGRGCAHSSDSLENIYMDVLLACVSMHHMCACVSAGAEVTDVGAWN